MKHITREGLKKMIDDREEFSLLYVLSGESFNKGYIPTSINIPWREITTRESELSKDKAVIVYCASFKCNASARAGIILEMLGYKVIEYDGGIEDWKHAGYSLEGSNNKG